MKQPLVLCRRWLEEENEMMDLVSGAEVPEAEIKVSPEMIEAGREAWHRNAGDIRLSDVLTVVYRAMRRVELSRKEPTP